MDKKLLQMCLKSTLFNPLLHFILKLCNLNQMIGFHIKFNTGPKCVDSEDIKTTSIDISDVVIVNCELFNSFMTEVPMI